MRRESCHEGVSTARCCDFPVVSTLLALVVVTGEKFPTLISLQNLYLDVMSSYVHKNMRDLRYAFVHASRVHLLTFVCMDQPLMWIHVFNQVNRVRVVEKLIQAMQGESDLFFPNVGVPTFSCSSGLSGQRRVHSYGKVECSSTRDLCVGQHGSQNCFLSRELALLKSRFKICPNTN